MLVLTWAPWRRLTSGASSGHVRNCSFWYWYLEMLRGRFLWFCLKCRRSPPPRAFRSFNHANQFFHRPLQDPDFQLLMAVYDENILKNPFYLALEKQRPDLCSRVAELHGIVSPTSSLLFIWILFTSCYNQPVCLSELQSGFPLWGFPQFLSLCSPILYFCFLTYWNKLSLVNVCFCVFDS